jgi:hypothetical protein
MSRQRCQDRDVKTEMSRQRCQDRDVKTEMSRQRCQDRDVKTEMEGKRGTSENPSMTKKAERKRSFRRATLFFSASSTFITVLTVSL